MNHSQLSIDVFAVDPRRTIVPALTARASRRADPPAPVTSRPCNTFAGNLSVQRMIFRLVPSTFAAMFTRNQSRFDVTAIPSLTQ
jgi:hypothetical protein